MTPTLGVVIPVGGDHGRYVMDAVQSLHNGSVPDEIAVVYDHVSMDERRVWPVAIMFGPAKIHLLDIGEKRGPAAARNVGLRALATDYVFYLDADDTVTPHAIEVLRREIGGDGGVDLVHARMAVMTRGEQWKANVNYDSVDLLIERVELGIVPNIGANVCVRRDWALAIGGHDEALPYADDLDFAIRYVFSRHAFTSQVPECLVTIRSETSTRNTGHIVQDMGPFLERLKSGYYLHPEAAK